MLCIRLELPNEEGCGSAQHVYGAADLDDDDQEKVEAELKKSGVPTHIKTIDPDDPNFIKAKTYPRVAPPPSMTLELLPYQEEGHGWMIGQEAKDNGNGCRGGILADEMGMGKTIQTIATIVAGLPKNNSNKVPPTLVVAPSSAMLQWGSEITKALKPGTCKVLVVYGNRTKLTVEKIMEHDVVLTTYPVIEYEYRKIVNKHKVACQYCGKKLLPRSLVWHNKYFCGPDAVRTLKQAKQEKTNKKTSTVKAMETLRIIKPGEDLPEGAGGTGGKRGDGAGNAEDEDEDEDEDDAGDGTGKAEGKAKANGKAKAKANSKRSGSSVKRRGGIKGLTPMAIYNDLMAEANRTPLHMGEKASTDVSAGMSGGGGSSEDGGSDGDFHEEPVRVSKKAAARKKGTTAAKTTTKAAKGGSVAATVAVSAGTVAASVTKGVEEAEKEAEKEGEGGAKKRNGSSSNRGRGLSKRKGSTSKPAAAAAATAAAASVGVGGKVKAYFRGSAPKYTGVVVAINDDGTYDIRFDDGDEEQSVKAAHVFNNATGKSIAATAVKHEGAEGDEMAGGGDDDEVQAKVAAQAKKKPSSARGTKKKAAPPSTAAKRARAAEPEYESENDDFEPNSQVTTEPLPPKKKANTRSARTKTASGATATATAATAATAADGGLSRQSPRLRSKPSVSMKEDSASSGSESEYDAAQAAKEEEEAIDSSGDDNASNFNGGDDDDDFEPNSQVTTEPSPAKRKASAKPKLKPKRAGAGAGAGAGKASTKGSSSKKKTTKKGASASKKGSKKGSTSSSSDDDTDDADDSRGGGGGGGPAPPAEFAEAGKYTDPDGLDLNTSILHCIPWTRIVLDEAHKIKSRTNSTAKAIFAIPGEIRWCLTGTPLQNRVSELFALIRFLEMEPFAFYQCSKNGCDCKSMHWQFGPSQKFCEQCDHPKMNHFAYFNKHIINPIKRYGYTGQGRTAMLTLKDQVLGKVMLRRTKAERADDLKLPKLIITVQKLDLDEAEQDFYECIYKQTRSRFDKFVDKGTLLHNYAHVFELLSRLRQAVDHPYLVIHGSYRKKPAPLPSKSSLAGGADVCGICTLDILSARDCAVNSCRHTFHRDCILEYSGDQISSPQTLGKEGGAKKKPAGKKRGKKGKTKDIASTAKTCPVCFLPLQVTLDLRGMGDTEDEDDDEDDSNMPTVKKSRVSGKGKKKKTTAGKSVAAAKSGGAAASAADDDADDGATTCVVCMEQPRNALLMPCGHIYTCMDCVGKLRTKKCPICRASISRVVKTDRAAPAPTPQSPSSPSDSGGAKSSQGNPRKGSGALVGRDSIVQQLDMSAFSSSTKVTAVVDAVLKILKNDKTDKTIIFSQYNRMIDLVEHSLKVAGLQTVKLMGYMPVQQRKSVLTAFKTTPEIPVILMSLKAGGEGLNLQEANHVLVLEPWWNPQVEMQAIQRAHRIGQTKDVHAVRFITAGTIEDRMLELQSKKQLVFEGAIDSNAASMSQLTQEDLRFLFGGS